MRTHVAVSISLVLATCAQAGPIREIVAPASSQPAVEVSEPGDAVSWTTAELLGTTDSAAAMTSPADPNGTAYSIPAGASGDASADETTAASASGDVIRGTGDIPTSGVALTGPWMADGILPDNMVAARFYHSTDQRASVERSAPLALRSFTPIMNRMSRPVSTFSLGDQHIVPGPVDPEPDTGFVAQIGAASSGPGTRTEMPSAGIEQLLAGEAPGAADERQVRDADRWIAGLTYFVIPAAAVTLLATLVVFLRR